MKEKKTKTEISTNLSSGAEKVEIVEKEISEKRGQNSGANTSAPHVDSNVSKQESTVVTAKSGEKKKVVAKKREQAPSEKAKKEERAAKARVDAALKRKEAQANKKEARAKARAERQEQLAKRKAERQARLEKRKAEIQAQIEKMKAERKARAEKRKAEFLALQEELQRERAHAKANRSQAKSKAKNARKKQRENRRENRRENGKNKERRERTKGYGGWLAAVISLGAVTLALTTAVTVGAIDMKRTNEGLLSTHRAATNELIGIMENVENDLDRARVSASPVQQSRILTDLLVQARLAELDLEKIPVEAERNVNVTAFVNRVARECERMLTKLRNGEKLSNKDREVLQSLYETNHSARETVSELSQTMTDNDITDMLKKGTGMLSDVMDKLESITLDENKINNEKTQAGMERNGIAPPMGEENAQKIEPSKAEELCSVYFSSYNIEEFQCIGETVARSYTAYNVQGYDKNGTLLFAEVDCLSGKLLRFDYYEDCSEETFDMENAQRIAEEFLSSLGYEDMIAVRVRENGTDSDFTFVYSMDGTVVYPDTVRVKICRSRGVVTAFDATKYVRNHDRRMESRTKLNVALSLPQAQAKLQSDLTVEHSRLAVVDTARGERMAYEFLCAYGEEKYVIYLDGETGEEIAIINIRNLS